MSRDEEARRELERLIIERREDYASLSRLIGRNAAYIQQYVKRGTPKRLSEADRRMLAKYFGIAEHVLGGLEQPTSSLSHLVPIPRLEVSASAGPGSIADREGSIAHIAFDPAWLKTVTRASSAELSIIRVQGDSMHPTLADGDDILVDTSEIGRSLRDGVFVLRREESLLVKRLAIHPNGRTLTISSDNPAYPTWADCKPDSINLIGRVIWAGRRLV
jgi:phage repressor protein C with HTH and peptisase S24 domain